MLFFNSFGKKYKQPVLKIITNIWFVFFVAVILRLIELLPVALNNFSILARFVPEIRDIPANIIQGKGFILTKASQLLSIPVDPLYPLLATGVFLITGLTTFKSYIFLTIINVLFSSLIVFILFYIGTALKNTRTGLIAAWLYALFSINTNYNFFVWYSVALLPFLHCLILLYLILYIKSKHNRYLYLVGITIGLAFLTKPVSVFFIGIALLYFFINQKFPLKKIIILLATVLVCLSPWLIRNYLIFKTFYPTRGTYYVTLCNNNINNPEASIKQSLKNSIESNQQEHHIFSKLGEINYYKYKQKLFKTWLRENPLIFLKLTLKRIYNHWFGEVFLSEYTFKPVFLIKFFALRLLLIFWLFYIFKNNIFLKWQNLIFIFLIIFAPLAYYITNTYILYILEFEPLLVLPGALWINSRIKK